MDRQKPVRSKEAPLKCACPTCKRMIATPHADTPESWRYFPFCSERCKMIDLGAWLDAEYTLPVQADEDFENLPQDEIPNDLS